MNTIKNFIEKRKITEPTIGRLSGSFAGYNEALDDLIANLPSLMKEIESEVLKVVGEDEKVEHHESCLATEHGESYCDCHWPRLTANANQERSRLRSALTQLFNNNKE